MAGVTTPTTSTGFNCGSGTAVTSFNVGTSGIVLAGWSTENPVTSSAGTSYTIMSSGGQYGNGEYSTTVTGTTTAPATTGVTTGTTEAAITFASGQTFPLFTITGPSGTCPATISPASITGDSTAHNVGTNSGCAMTITVPNGYHFTPSNSGTSSLTVCSGLVTCSEVNLTYAAGAILIAPVISVSPTTIDSGQVATLSTTTSFSGGTSTYTCQWLYKVPGGSSYSDLGSSFGSSGGCTTSGFPTASTGVLSSTGTWSFELHVTDSSTPAQVGTSNVVTVSVSSALITPVISVSPSMILSGNSASLSTTTPFSGGTSTYTCQWLDEIPGGGSYNNLGSPFSSGCTTSSTPSTSTGALSTKGVWQFKLQVTDSVSSTVVSNAVSVTVETVLVLYNPQGLSIQYTSNSVPSSSAATVLSVDANSVFTGTWARISTAVTR